MTIGLRFGPRLVAAALIGLHALPAGARPQEQAEAAAHQINPNLAAQLMTNHVVTTQQQQQRPSFSFSVPSSVDAGQPIRIEVARASPGGGQYQFGFRVDPANLVAGQAPIVMTVGDGPGPWSTDVPTNPGAGDSQPTLSITMVPGKGEPLISGPRLAKVVITPAENQAGTDGNVTTATTTNEAGAGNNSEAATNNSTPVNEVTPGGGGDGGGGGGGGGGSFPLWPLIAIPIVLVLGWFAARAIWPPNPPGPPGPPPANGGGGDKPPVEPADLASAFTAGPGDPSFAPGEPRLRGPAFEGRFAIVPGESRIPIPLPLRGDGR